LSTKYITLDDAPEILRQSVEEEMGRFPFAKLLSVTEYTSTPFKDKTVIETRYTAHIEIGNYFLVLKYSICSNPDWTDREVRESGMIAAEIIEFVKNSEMLQYGVRIALQEEGATSGCG
jgi:hypothetical protein